MRKFIITYSHIIYMKVVEEYFHSHAENKYNFYSDNY